MKTPNTNQLVSRRLTQGCPASVLVTVLATALMSAASARAADPQFQRMEPLGGARGSDVSVTLYGPRMASEPKDLLFYEPGIELLELKNNEKGDAVVAQLRIAADCPPGPHAIRLLTASGLSNLRTFHVGSLAEAKEQEPNDSPDQAQAIALGTVVDGVVRREDLDHYALELEAGQRLSIEVEAIRLGQVFFDPAVEVYGPDGQLLGEADDSPPTRQDPALSVQTPTAGKYIVRVRESALRGADNNRYRLHVGDFPRPQAIFPPAVQHDQPTDLHDAQGAASVANQARLGSTDDGMARVFPTDEQGIAPSSMALRVGDRPVTAEAEPNNALKQATPSAAPAACVGRLEKPGDTDFYRFTAKKDQTWDLNVYARRLRSPLDSILRVFDANGKRLAGSDDDQGQPDSYLRFKVPADGDYILQVADHLNRGGADYVYALELARPRPEARLSINEERRYVSTTANVPQGNRTAILVTTRRANFGDPLTVSVDGLPAGVTMDAPELAANYNVTPIVLSADESAEVGATLASVTVKRPENRPVVSLFRQQEWLVRGRNNVAMWSYWSDRAPVAVTRKAPFSVDLVAPKAPLVQSGSMALRVVAKRDEGFDAPIAVRMLYHSPGVSSNRSRSIAAGQTEVTIPVTANYQARTGDWDIVVTGESNVGGRLVVSTQLVKLTVAEPFFSLALPKATVERGKSIEYTVAIEPKTPFEGVAKLEMVGLPPGVTTAPVEIKADAKSATFQLAVSDKAPLGRHRSPACRATLAVEGEPVVHTRGGGELMIDPPPEKETKPKDQQTAQRKADREATGKGASS